MNNTSSETLALWKEIEARRKAKQAQAEAIWQKMVDADNDAEWFNLTMGD